MKRQKRRGDWVATYLPAPHMAKFRSMARELGLTRYALAQKALLAMLAQYDAKEREKGGEK